MLQRIIEFCLLHGIDQSKAHLTYNTCLDLIERHKYWDVSWGCTDEQIHCTGKCSKDGIVQYFIPVLATDCLSIRQILNIQHIFREKSICLAIQSSSSTILYYQVSEGLGRNAPHKVDKLYTNSQLRANSKQIMTAAHSPNLKNLERSSTGVQLKDATSSQVSTG